MKTANRFDFRVAMLNGSIANLAEQRAGHFHQNEPEMLRVIADIARSLADAAEEYATDLEKPKTNPDADLLATLERIAQIGGTVDVRA